MDFANLDSQSLVPIKKLENKIDFSVMRNIKEVSIETGVDWESVNMCNLSFKYNVNEISRGEKGLYLFRMEDLSGLCNKKMICCNNLKDLRIQIESPDIKNNTIDYRPSLIIKKANKSGYNCFCYESNFEIYQNFGGEEKLFAVIEYKKEFNTFQFYIGERENSMKYKVIGNFSGTTNYCYKLCNLNMCKPKPVDFEIILPLAIEIKVGSLTKFYRSAFEDLHKEKIMITFPPEATAEEKVWFICLGAILNLILFGDND